MKQRDMIFDKSVQVKIHLNYLLYLPEEYNADQNKKWPLILFLHGAGERGNNLDTLRCQALPRLIEEKGDFKAVIVSPQCPEDSSWSFQFRALDELLDEIIKNYRIDNDKIYLTGLSMGGFAAWDYAVTHPDRFAAVIPICGGTSYPYKLEAIKNIPVWVFHRAQDDIVPIEESEVAVEMLENAGGNVKFTIYPDAGHDSWTKTYNNPEVFEWLLKQKKS